MLAQIAKTQPHAAHAGYVHGLRSKWVFHQRSMVYLELLLGPLEKELNEKLIPAIFGSLSAVSKLERDLFALPGRYSGMGLDNPKKSAPHQFRSSLLLSKKHAELILNDEPELKLDDAKQKAIKAKLRSEKEARLENEYQRIYLEADKQLQKCMENAKEKGASCLVTTLPLDRDGFPFPCKRDFRDLICLC